MTDQTIPESADGEVKAMARLQSAVSEMLGLSAQSRELITAQAARIEQLEAALRSVTDKLDNLAVMPDEIEAVIAARAALELKP